MHKELCDETKCNYASCARQKSKTFIDFSIKHNKNPKVIIDFLLCFVVKFYVYFY